MITIILDTEDNIGHTAIAEQIERIKWGQTIRDIVFDEDYEIVEKAQERYGDSTKHKIILRKLADRKDETE